MDIHRRAVKDDQKLARRQAILDVAWGLYEESSYGAVTMAAVAERAGLAKGTVYLYFQTKEEMFLALQEQHLAGWFMAVNSGLVALPGHDPPGEVAALISTTLEARPGLTRLTAIMYGILEQNIDFATAARYKRVLLGHLAETGPLLERALPFLAPGQGAGVLLQINALVVGLQSMADPAPIIQTVLEEPDLGIFRIHFAHAFADAFRALLLGRQQDAQSAS